ncbi:MAG TPA: DUF4199 domain-containing protein [Saprospiraceae bacterium]|nr:DUF4199 domain-containing protein [Saprospiraceae bacterium]
MNNLRTEVKWALIWGASLLIWMALERAFGLHGQYIEYHYSVTSIFLVVVVGIYVLELFEKRRIAFEGRMTYKQGVFSALILTLIITILSPLLQVIISEVITPNYFNNVINHVVEEGMMTEEEARKQFNLGNYLLQSAVGSALFGVVLSLILPAFLKKS